MNQLAKAFLFFDFKQKSRPTRTAFFHITSVFISTTGNNCRQDVVKDFADVNIDAGILPQIAEPTLKESFHHAVYMAKNKEPPSIPGSPFSW